MEPTTLLAKECFLFTQLIVNPKKAVYSRPMLSYKASTYFCPRQTLSLDK